MLISVACLLHLLMVADQLFAKNTLPTTSPWLRWSQTNQKWRMFSNPKPRGGYVESFGVRADGTELELVPSSYPPEGPYLRLRYDRMLKVQFNLPQGDSSHFQEPYAAWLCSLDEDLVSVRVEHIRAWRPRKRKWLNNPEVTWEEERSVLVERSCP